MSDTHYVAIVVILIVGFVSSYICWWHYVKHKQRLVEKEVDRFSAKMISYINDLNGIVDEFESLKSFTDHISETRKKALAHRTAIIDSRISNIPIGKYLEYHPANLEYLIMQSNYAIKTIALINTRYLNLGVRSW